ncbi:indolepyruvate oxidoreductase subunit beta [Symmachiella dynata]|uniref:Indolepyruvate oxidoreductase subunit beta n=1 Tax=Symmachiella dynata TaxID=2527995 RepID=A0A517ZWX3_9PLAN|nr:indolepyruvate oxidoreductase subunit beta [Symmachiella dynata]QDU46974.1 indolepyruvate oxidoreductase subunit beta [Symmachiella dynata]
MRSATLTSQSSVMFTGVGGQGILLAGDVLAAVALQAGLDVKKSEIRGLSRRFGSVWCQVRMAEEVHSPVCGEGAIDFLVSLEMQEGLRRLPYLNNNGTALINRLWIDSNGTSRSEPPPEFDELKYSNCLWLDGTETTHNAEQTRSLNFYMLGALSGILPFDESTWKAAIESVVQPRFLPANLEMFAAGSDAVLMHPATPRKPK